MLFLFLTLRFSFLVLHLKEAFASYTASSDMTTRGRYEVTEAAAT